MSSNVTRRLVLRGTAVAIAGAALAAPSALAAGRAASTAATDHSGHGGHGGPEAFDEVYQGRRIVGRPAEAGSHGAHHGGGFSVLIDGQELHVMQNADGTWISVVNHYEPFATPRAVARAAVDKLRGATLVPIAV
ncbi:tyrosinase cofactor [Streptomyces sp. ISL-11]|uniref:apotyrosinase chaperone MelC1 n=1 Tax=Streptomyces sp. ISL-11 TaxID=2819174 RepID=UPI001BE76D13|nr:tyrosinase cofactor [Streptomyces sp. ISL-11]MBT2387001.1 tyrosinase cofactor [Streptomyces sp. ISL-11]